MTVHVSGCGCECECVEVEGGTTSALNPLSRPIHDQFLEPKCSCELTFFCVYTQMLIYRYMHACTHTCVCGCACACACACVRVCVCMCACMYVYFGAL